MGGEPVFLDGELIGSITSGAYGFTVEKSLATAYVDATRIKDVGSLQVSILGTLYAASVELKRPLDAIPS